MKWLYEFSVLLECAYVVAAESEEAARKAIETFEGAFYEDGDFIGVNSVELSDIRKADQDCLEDLAHEIV